jgi:molybdopterin converting factor subunit 1
VTVRLRFFATLREQLGASIERDVPRGTTVEGLWEWVVAERPALRRLRVTFAVGERYVEGSHRVKAGDEVAFFPPVSGGR